MTMMAESFVASARTLLGVKWRHLGRSEHGVDCIGLLALSFNKVNVPFEDVRVYSREPIPGVLQAECRKRWGDPFSRKVAKPGDIATVRWGPKGPSHVGIIGDHPYGWLTLIHAHCVMGVIEQSLNGSIFSVVQEVYRPWSAP